MKAISLLLVARGKTKVWLAEQLGESQFWVGRRMNGSVKITLQDLDRLAAVFGISVAELLSVPGAIPKAREAVSA